MSSKLLSSTAPGVGRFTQIGIPHPQILAPFVGVCEILFGALLIIGLFTRLATIPLLWVSPWPSGRRKFPRFHSRDSGGWFTRREATSAGCSASSFCWPWVRAGFLWMHVYRVRQSIRHAFPNFRDRFAGRFDVTIATGLPDRRRDGQPGTAPTRGPGRRCQTSGRHSGLINQPPRRSRLVQQVQAASQRMQPRQHAFGILGPSNKADSHDPVRRHFEYVVSVRRSPGRCSLARLLLICFKRASLQLCQDSQQNINCFRPVDM